MATVGGLSNGASNSVSMYGASIKGYGGLASGLDTDSLIEGMTTGTRTKIQEALKKKQNYQWEMDGYRSVSDQLIGFSGKYLDITSSSSPYRTSFFDRSVVTAHGLNSKNLSVSGASGSISSMIVRGIKQLAKDSSLVTKENNSVQSLNTSGIDFGADIDTSRLEGGNIVFNLGDYNYTLKMVSGDELYGAGVSNPSFPDDLTKRSHKTDFSTAESTANTINAMLKNTKIMNSDDYLGDKIEMTVNSDGKFVLKQTDQNATENITISGGTAESLKTMGLMYENGLLVDGGVIPTSGELIGDLNVRDPDPEDQAGNPNRLVIRESFGKFMGDKIITFSYNGSAKKIKLPPGGVIDAWFTASNDPTNDKMEGMKKLAESLNGKLADAFGAGKIEVAVGSSKKTDGTVGDPSLSFTTKDPSSVLRITDADTGIMGVKGIFGISYSTTNRMSVEVPLVKSGMKAFGLPGLPDHFGEYKLVDEGADKIPPEVTGRGKRVYTPTAYNDAKGNLYLNINGKDIPQLKDADGNDIKPTPAPLTVDSSLLQIMTAINDSDAGVKMSYTETADRISFISTNRGEAGDIDISVPGTGNQMNFLHLLVGAKKGDHNYVQGQDAIMTVQYEGNMEVDIKRDSNSFNMEGSTFTLSGVFGFKLPALVNEFGDLALDQAGNPITEPVQNPDGTWRYDYPRDAQGKIKYDTVDGTEPVTFTSAVDTERAVKVIGEMVTEYNKIADLVNKLVGTKPNRDYGPLTDDEKSQLNADQIKQLEDKAKEGILFNDTLLRSLAEKMRSVFSGGTDVGTLSKMGLTVSSSWKDNGKVNFDGEKFKNALLEDSEKVKKIFTEPATKNAKGETEKAGGISVRLKAITDDFAGVSGFIKGSLITKAGSSAVSTSILDNAIKKQMDVIDKEVERLKDKLQTEIDRYTKQFSSLEQLISQMNSQSSWFTQGG